MRPRSNSWIGALLPAAVIYACTGAPGEQFIEGRALPPAGSGGLGGTLSFGGSGQRAGGGGVPAVAGGAGEMSGGVSSAGEGGSTSAPLPPSGAAGASGGAGGTDGTGGTSGLVLCQRLRDPVSVADDVRKQYVDRVWADCRVARMLQDRRSQLFAFYNSFLRWNLRFWGCDAPIIEEEFGLAFEPTELSLADTLVLIEHYLVAATDQLDLSRSERVAMEQTLEELAERAITTPAETLTWSNCGSPVDPGGEGGSGGTQAGGAAGSDAGLGGAAGVGGDSATAGGSGSADTGGSGGSGELGGAGGQSSAPRGEGEREGAGEEG